MRKRSLPWLLTLVFWEAPAALWASPPFLSTIGRDTIQNEVTYTLYAAYELDL